MRRVHEEIRTMRWPYAEGDASALAELEKRLAESARRHALVTYTELVRGLTFRLPNVAQGQPFQLGVPEWTELHSAILKDFLNHISCDSYLRGGFLASALAVRKITGEPSEGFRSLVDKLGLFHSSKRDDFAVFWSQEVQKTYDWYASHPARYGV